MIYLELLWVFGKIGAVTFGGGYAMISLFLQEVVSRGWCTPEEFANIVAVAQMTPGAIAMNTATYVGKITGGIPGAIIASCALVVPPLIYIAGLIYLASLFRERPFLKPYLQPVIKGIRCAAVGLIGTAVLFFAENSIVTAPLPLNIRQVLTMDPSIWDHIDFRLPAVVIFVVVFILGKATKWGPIPSITLSIVLGIGLFGLLPMVF